MFRQNAAATTTTTKKYGKLIEFSFFIVEKKMLTMLIQAHARCGTFFSLTLSGAGVFRWQINSNLCNLKVCRTLYLPSTRISNYVLTFLSPENKQFIFRAMNKSSTASTCPKYILFPPRRTTTYAIRHYAKSRSVDFAWFLSSMPKCFLCLARIERRTSRTSSISSKLATATAHSHTRWNFLIRENYFPLKYIKLYTWYVKLISINSITKLPEECTSERSKCGKFDYKIIKWHSPNQKL